MFHLYYAEVLMFCFLTFSGRLPHSARMFGEIYVNGAKSHFPYGTYVS